MKRNNKSAIALIALSLLALSSGAAFAGHHWGNNDGMWQQGGSPLTTEQQATAQKIMMITIRRPARCASN